MSSPTTPPTEASPGFIDPSAPIEVRAYLRKMELQAMLETLPPDQAAIRPDIERALAAIEPLLAGDTENLSEATAAELGRWLEEAGHFGTA